MSNSPKTITVMAGLLIGLFTIGAVLLAPGATAYAAEPSTIQGQPGHTMTMPPASQVQAPPTEPPATSSEDGHSDHH